MWIKKKEYDDLKAYKVLCEKLEEETKRLAELISSETTDCQVGRWCKDCRHVGYDGSETEGWDLFYGEYTKMSGGKVMYCKKHLHEICPEFEMKGDS